MSIGRWIGAAALAASTASCSVITTSDYDVRQPPTLCGNDPDAERQDFVLHLRGMGPAHADQHVLGAIVRRVDTVGGVLRSRRVGGFDLTPLGADDQDLVMPCLIDRSTTVESTYELLLWANADDDPAPSCVPGSGGTGCVDHQWVVPIADDGDTDFEHNGMFNDIAAGRMFVPRPGVTPSPALPVSVDFDRMDAFVGQTMVLQIRAFEDGPGDPVILYHRRVIGDRDAAPETSFELRAVDVVQNDESVVAELWIDTNGNGTYDPPDPTNPNRDYSTSVLFVADGDGASTAFDGAALPPAAAISL